MAELYRQIKICFWSDPNIVDSFSPEDKLLYLYLMTNEYTNLCGIYEISLKQIAFDTGYSQETIKAILDRFQGHLKRIRYNPETHEMAILNWPKYNYPEKISDNRFVCIMNEFKGVKDKSLIAEILKQANKDIRAAFTVSLPQERAKPVDEAPAQSPAEAPQEPLISPLQAPPEPLKPVIVIEQVQEKEDTARPREEAHQEAPLPRGADPDYIPPQIESPHFKIASEWFKRFNKTTGLTTMPDERSMLAAKKLLKFLGGDQALALKAVDYYFDNWQDLWFACARASRKNPKETRAWEFRFDSFASPENIQEILSKMMSVPNQAKGIQEPWCSAPPLPPRAPEEVRKADAQQLHEFVANLGKAKITEMAK
jgi:hypothetical protein